MNDILTSVALVPDTTNNNPFIDQLNTPIGEDIMDKILIDGKPINIGVVMHRATSVNGVPVFGQNTAYLEYMSRLGNVIMISPRDTYIHEELHAICLPGGADVEEMGTSSYKQGNTNPHSTYFFQNMFKHYSHLPVLGICMGMQAVLCYTSDSVITPHVNLPVSKPRDQEIDTLCHYTKDSTGALMLTGGKKTLTKSKTSAGTTWKINSIHHQAFFPENIDTTRYDILHLSHEYGNVEIVQSKDGNQLLLQAHPEEMNCDTTIFLFTNIIRNYYKL